jgi:hypothetical protein
MTNPTERPASGKPVMDDKTYLDMLLAFYSEQVEHARHHEVMRAESTNYILAASTALLGLASAGAVFGVQWDQRAKLLVPIIVIILNVFGMLLSVKYYERNRLHVTIARKYRSEISNRFSQPTFEPPDALREAGRLAAKKKYPVLEKVRLHWLWIGLHGLFALIALALLVLATI